MQKDIEVAAEALLAVAKLARERGELAMVSDQIGLPKPNSTHEEDVAGLKQSL